MDNFFTGLMMDNGIEKDDHGFGLSILALQSICFFTPEVLSRLRYQETQVFCLGHGSVRFLDNRRRIWQ